MTSFQSGAKALPRISVVRLSPLGPKSERHMYRGDNSDSNPNCFLPPLVQRGGDTSQNMPLVKQRSMVKIERLKFLRKHPEPRVGNQM